MDLYLLIGIDPPVELFPVEHVVDEVPDLGAGGKIVVNQIDQVVLAGNIIDHLKE